MTYLKLETDKPIECLLQEYKGKVQSDYQGHVTTKHAFVVNVDGALFDWEATEFTATKMIRDGIKAGMRVVIVKEFNNGKYYINVYPADDAMATAKLSEAKQNSKEIKQDSNNKDEKITMGMATNNATRLLAAEIIAGWHKQGTDMNQQAVDRGKDFFKKYTNQQEIAEESEEAGLDALPF